MRRFACLLLACWVVAASAAPLKLVGEPYPPYLVESKAGLGGPFAEAITSLLKAEGIEVQFQALPFRRLLLEVGKQENSCALAVYFSPSDAETLNYVARLAPLTLAVYARAGEVGRLSNLENLRKYSVGAIDIAEVRDLLGASAIPYAPIAFANTGPAMLKARRFDLLISDASQQMIKQAGVPIDRVFTLARVERWLACNPALPPKTVAALRRVLREGVLAESVRPIWRRHGLEDYFDQSRRAWEDSAGKR
ncbi:hypothetical protein [Chitinimonas sp.]|uniref:hypothetical protein n=1 Tax=Chitinimonas sp. TaxID=1934313 RepID=UPI0035B3374A